MRSRSEHSIARDHARILPRSIQARDPASAQHRHVPTIVPSPLSLTDDKEELSRLEDACSARINVTFRFYRPDYTPSSTPLCKCGVPCILRPDMKNRYEDLSEPSKSRDGGTKEKDGHAAISGTKASSSKAVKRTLVAKYWWTCYAGVQNDGKGCDYWRVMDVKAEGRGPFVGDVTEMAHVS